MIHIRRFFIGFLYVAGFCILILGLLEVINLLAILASKSPIVYPIYIGTFYLMASYVIGHATED